MLDELRECYDPVGRHAALPGHLDAPMHVIELGNRMCIRTDAHHAAEFERRLVPAPIEVETPWMGVDLDGDVMLGACAQHFLDVNFVAWPPL